MYVWYGLLKHTKIRNTALEVYVNEISRTNIQLKGTTGPVN